MVFSVVIITVFTGNHIAVQAFFNSLTSEALW
jgi:hypothetical protein